MVSEGRCGRAFVLFGGFIAGTLATSAPPRWGAGLPVRPRLSCPRRDGPPARDRTEGRGARNYLLLGRVRHVRGAPLREQHGGLSRCSRPSRRCWWVAIRPGHRAPERPAALRRARTDWGLPRRSRPASLAGVLSRVAERGTRVPAKGSRLCFRLGQLWEASGTAYSTVTVAEAWFSPLSAA
jgi:hypothetical protein